MLLFVDNYHCKRRMCVMYFNKLWKRAIPPPHEKICWRSFISNFGGLLVFRRWGWWRFLRWNRKDRLLLGVEIIQALRSFFLQRSGVDYSTYVADEPTCQHSPHQAKVKLDLGFNTWSYIWAINCTSMLFCRCCISCSVILLNSSGFLSLILVKQLANFSWLQNITKWTERK